MGTGVGEAMLIGAATGAGTSAITGQDPLKGALLGAVGGAVMPGVGQALGGAPTAAAAEAASVAGANTANAAATAAQQKILEAGGTQVAADEAFRETFLKQVDPFKFDVTKTAAPTGFTDVFKDTPGTTIGQRLGNYIVQNPTQTSMIGGGALNMLGNQVGLPEEEKYRGPLSRFRFNPNTYQPYQSTRMMASGGIADLPVTKKFVEGGDLGSYSDGGRLLKGPGDGMSDSIPAKIGKKQPARLADGEFVVPADVVSHLGNGSTDAGAKQLYAMMDRIRQDRTGNKKQGKEVKPRKYLPA